MENIVFWAKNDEEAKQIAINDFINKASKVLECYKATLETWIEHTPHTVFFDCYSAMFSEYNSKWVTKNDDKPIRLDTISKGTESILFERVKSFINSEKDMIKIMGDAEYPFIFIEKVEDNKYQYHIGT